MQVDESDQDSSKRQKVTHGADMELEGMESERDRLQRYSDCDFLMQVKQDADAYIDRNVFKDCKVRAVKKDLPQLGVHPSVHVAGVFSSPGKARFVHRIRSHPWISVGSENRMGLERSCPRAKVWSHVQQERPILIVGSWSGPGARTTHMRWMIDMYRWQVSQGRFFVHQHSGHVPLNAELCAMKSVVVSRIDW